MGEALDHLTSKLFSDHVHGSFTVVDAPSGPFDLELIEVQQRPASARLECFSLVFRGPQMPLLAQGMRRLQHQQLGAFVLFLTPMALDQNGAQYEAVFNRLQKTP